MTTTAQPSNRITHWIIRADQPFNGHAQSFLLSDGTVAYTNGLTPKTYAAERGFPVKVITGAEFDVLTAEHETSMITEPKEETQSEFQEALEVLPPCKWRTVRGVELFHISERITHDLVNWHSQTGGRYFAFVDRASRDMDELADKVGKMTRF